MVIADKRANQSAPREIPVKAHDRSTSLGTFLAKLLLVRNCNLSMELHDLPTSSDRLLRNIFRSMGGWVAGWIPLQNRAVAVLSV